MTVNESAGTMTFTVTRTGTSDVSIALDYASANGSALAGSDYTASTGTVTFAAGTGGTQTFTVPILGDSVVEGSESFTVNLTPQLASQVAAGSDLSALGTISDNDANTFSIGDVTVNELAGTMTFTVTRTGTSDVSIALDYASANGSALAGSDYTASTGTVTFAAGTGGTQTFTVPILGDSVVEGSESFTVNLTPQLASQVAAGSDLSALGTISDNDANTFSIGDVTVNESAGTMTFTVTRTGTSDVSIALDYASANGSALAGSDYTASTGTVTFAAGTGGTQTFTVPILGDLVVEGSESFTVNLTPQLASQVAAGSDLSALGTISDNDANTFSIGDVTVNESAGTMTFTVTRTGTSDVSIALDYASANGSALAGSDYTASTGTVTFAAGTGGTQTFTVPILGDSVVEGSESFTVNLTPQLASQVAAGSDLSALGTISDNDANTLSIGDVTVNELAGTMTFTVTRTGTSDVSIALDYASANGSALAGSDYTASTGTVTFAAGTGGTQTFTVPILGDSVVEGSESFTVNLTPQLASQVAAGSDLSALGTISDNDANTFSIGDVTVNESAGTMTFTVTRTGTSDVSIALDYASANGSALAGSDYTASTGTVTFAAGTGGTQTFTVPILGDSVVEGSESFTVNLTPQLASQVAAGSDLSALGTISDNDANTFSIGDVTVNEWAGTMTFTVTRTGTSDVSIALDYASANGSALAGSDYTASTGTVTFAAGTGGTQTFTVPILGDSSSRAARASRSI